MTEENHCIICKSAIVTEEHTNICVSCHRNIANLEKQIDGFNTKGLDKKL